MAAARSLLCRASSGVLNRVYCHRSPRVQSGSRLRSAFTQTLKTLVEKLPYFYQCRYSHASSINTPKNVSFFPPDLVQPHLIQGLPFARGCCGSFMISSSVDLMMRPALATPPIPPTSTKLQSQVPECLAKPCPLLPWWDVLTPTPPSSPHVSVALPHCRAGMRLISSSSLHELRHPFFRVLYIYLCVTNLISTLTATVSGIKPTLFNS